MFLCNKVNRYIISSKTANFNTKILNQVNFSRSCEFFVNLVIFANKPVAALSLVPRLVIFH